MGSYDPKTIFLRQASEEQLQILVKAVVQAFAQTYSGIETSPQKRTILGFGPAQRGLPHDEPDLRADRVQGRGHVTSRRASTDGRACATGPGSGADARDQRRWRSDGAGREAPAKGASRERDSTRRQRQQRIAGAARAPRDTLAILLSDAPNGARCWRFLRR